MPKKLTGSTRYAIYARCSTDDQKEGDFTTVDVQITLDSEYIQVHGGTLAGLYRDEGISGTTLKRPDFQRLLTDAKAGAFDAVIVTYMSRLGRGDSFTVAEYLLKEAGVRVEMVKETFTDDMAGFVNKTMTRFVDGMYVEQVRQWTKTKMQAMVQQGYVCGGTVPFGLCKQIVSDALMSSRNDREPPKRFMPHPEEAPLVRRTFEIFAETSSLAAVQAFLRTVSPRKWTPTSVSNMLRNPTYRGILKFGDWVNEQAHESIISPELWAAVRAADATRTRQPKKNPQDTFPYLLRGVVHCPHCGCKMTPARHTGRTGDVCYYECIRALKKQSEGCPVRRVNAGSLEKTLIWEISRAAQHPTRMNALIKEAVAVMPRDEALPQDYAMTSKRLREIDRQIANLTSAVAMGGGQLRPLLQKMEALEADRLKVEMRATELEAQVEVSKRKRPEAEAVCREWRRFMECWEEADTAERESIMQGMINRVEMQTKEEGTCLVAVLPQVPISNLELTDTLGAGVGLEPTTSGL